MTSKNNENIETENTQDSQSEDLKDSAVSAPEESSVQTEPSDDKTSASEPFTETPVQPAAPVQPAVKFEEKHGKRGVRLATLAIVLSLFVGGGVAYLSNQQAVLYKNQVEELKGQINALNAKINQKAAESAGLVKNLKNTTETMIDQERKSISSLQVAITDLKGRRPNDWLLAEADYLVKLAGRKLFLEKDVESATALMETADQRISALNDPSLVPLRKDMTKDIVALKAVPLIDKDGLAIRLITLQEQVDTLPLANAILPDAPVVEQKEVSGDIHDWQENLKASLVDFSEQFITFRTRDGNAIPLLSPEQHYYLKENIKGKIENAIRAIYRENGEAYKTSLKVANEWATQFFKLDDPTVAQFNKTLSELGQKNIETNYPTKLVSQKALSDVISERLRREITSMTMEEKK